MRVVIMSLDLDPFQIIPLPVVVEFDKSEWLEDLLEDPVVSLISTVVNANCKIVGPVFSFHLLSYKAFNFRQHAFVR